MRKILSRIIRCALKHSPVRLQKIASRVPFSRFSRLASWLFWGEETIEWRGVLVKVNPGHIHGFNVYFLGAYCEDEINKLIELCRHARIFVDVGANNGMVSMAVSRACPGLEVFAFEPDRNAAAEFRVNLNLNPGLANRVHLMQQAIAENDSDSYFHSSCDTSDIELGRLMPDRTTSADYIVSVTCLDTFFHSIGKYPDVVNIDVEGAELRVIRGMQGIFCKGFPAAMLIETHPFDVVGDQAAFKNEIKTTTQKFAYNLFRIDGGTCRPMPFSEDWSRPMHILIVKNNTGFYADK